jgi:hypothetical protein
MWQGGVIVCMKAAKHRQMMRGGGIGDLRQHYRLTRGVTRGAVDLI